VHGDVYGDVEHYVLCPKQLQIAVVISSAMGDEPCCNEKAPHVSPNARLFVCHQDGPIFEVSVAAKKVGCMQKQMCDRYRSSHCLME
jgi:hypothetical protein